jgi:hypothetical protein
MSQATIATKLRDSYRRSIVLKDHVLVGGDVIVLRKELVSNIASFCEFCVVADNFGLKMGLDTLLQHTEARLSPQALKGFLEIAKQLDGLPNPSRDVRVTANMVREMYQRYLNEPQDKDKGKKDGDDDDSDDDDDSKEEDGDEDGDNDSKEEDGDEDGDDDSDDDSKEEDGDDAPKEVPNDPFVSELTFGCLLC